MASQTTVEELIDYYTNLLIIQYRNQPKAQATIQLLAEMMVAAGIFFDVPDAYNVNAALGDTAVGTQLDIIGKYVGVDRFYTSITLTNYFALVNYSQASGLPASPPDFGLLTYATFSQFCYNGTLVYNDIITTTNALSDEDFLTLIQFVILCNNMNYSAGEIDEAIWVTFGAQLRAETSGNMLMAYFITGPITTLINTLVFKKLLPRPMGVGAVIVDGIGGLMFGLTNYAESNAGEYSRFSYGFSTYSNYATLAGQVLEYSQISQA